MAFQVIMFHTALWLCIYLLIGSAFAIDVPFVFDGTISQVADCSPVQRQQAYAATQDLAGVPSISAPRDDEILVFPVTGGGNSPGGISEKNKINLIKHH
ncbi:MAG: hypothetical protein JW999_04805 [Methanotrichaceae archaeon]|nr:hypothetical protein [Methanotrichaceae archaeon]